MFSVFDFHRGAGISAEIFSPRIPGFPFEASRGKEEEKKERKHHRKGRKEEKQRRINSRRPRTPGSVHSRSSFSFSRRRWAFESTAARVQGAVQVSGRWLRVLSAWLRWSVPRPQFDPFFLKASLRSDGRRHAPNPLSWKRFGFQGSRKTK